MRFNDLLRTVLANIGDGASATVTRWRQCIDLLAQYDVSGTQSANALTDEERGSILGLIDEMRPRISLEQRIASVVELGPRLRSPGLVWLLSKDHPVLVVAMMKQVHLTGADWADIMPELGPLARSVLRSRTDLEPKAVEALRRFGEIDLSLPSFVLSPVLESVLPNESEMEPHADQRISEEPPRDMSGAAVKEASQIERLVAQIERFKHARMVQQEFGDDTLQALKMSLEGQAPSKGERVNSELYGEEASTPPQIVDHFLFETDASGLVQLVDTAPRGAVCGLSIATAALDSRLGADGAALGAFRHRAAFENARFIIGEGPLEGAWRIGGQPHFNRATGRFLGYTGSARREYRHEGPVRVAEVPAAAGWAGLSAASTRQLIHELRTPLNAMQGYGEMIEAQIVGPVSEAYREMARTILNDARILLATFEDLDAASRIERGDAHAAPEAVNVEALLRNIVVSLEGQGERRVDVIVDGSLPMIEGDRPQIERLLNHLLRAGRAALASSERLNIRVSTDSLGASVSVTMRRPAALDGIADKELMDHGYLVDQKLRGEPLPLGLAFTLKLIHGLARHLGGSFVISSRSFGLMLPAMQSAGTGHEHKG